MWFDESAWTDSSKEAHIERGLNDLTMHDWVFSQDLIFARSAAVSRVQNTAICPHPVYSSNDRWIQSKTNDDFLSSINSKVTDGTRSANEWEILHRTESRSDYVHLNPGRSGNVENSDWIWSSAFKIWETTNLYPYKVPTTRVNIIESLQNLTNFPEIYQ